MTVGIVITVVVGLVAVYQTLAADQYCKAAHIYRDAMNALKVRNEALTAKHERIALAMDAVQRAAARGDHRAMRLAIDGVIEACHAPAPADAPPSPPG